MSTKKEADFDYQVYSEADGPDRTHVRRGEMRRAKPLGTGKERITIRLDEDVLEEFRRLAPGGRGYQGLINRALREWLAARGMKELVREEVRGLVAEAKAERGWTREELHERGKGR